MSALTDFVLTGSGYTADAIDRDVDSWLNAVRPLGGTPSLARIALLNTLVTGLKTDNVWTKLDRLWIFAQELQSGALVDLVANSRATAVGSPTFTADQGFTGEDATFPTKYINTGFNPTAGINYTQNSAHHSLWSLTNITASNGGIAQGGSGRTDIGLGFFSGNPALYHINSTAGGGGLTPTTLVGHWLANRSSSSATQFYQNGSSVASNGSDTSAAPDSINSFILAWNAAGAPQYGNPNTIAMSSWGASLTATDVLNLYTRLATYLGGVAADKWVRSVGPENVSTTRRTTVATLTAGLMVDGVWPKLDRLWLFAAENTKSALIDLVARSSATPVASPTFTADRGYASNGSSSYVNTGFVLASGSNYTQNSAHYSVWIDTASATNSCAAGVTGANSNDTQLYGDTSAGWGIGSNNHSINQSGSGTGETTPATGAQLISLSVTASTTIKAYNNGSQVGTTGTTATQAAPTTYPVFVGARDNMGSADSYSTHRISAYIVGGGLSNTEVANLYTRLRAYMTAVGVP